MQGASSRYLVLRILHFGTELNFSKKPNAISLFAAKIASLINPYVIFSPRHPQNFSLSHNPESFMHSPGCPPRLSPS